MVMGFLKLLRDTRRWEDNDLTQILFRQSKPFQQKFLVPYRKFIDND